MAMYEHKCTRCNLTFCDGDIGHVPCPICKQPTVRRFSFSTVPSFKDGYCVTTGSYVKNERDFITQLDRASDAATARNGIPHRYRPVDLRDKDALGITDEGLAEHAKRVSDSAQGLPS
jgi:hypothetical protein